jgi:hypothetical protein
MAMHQHNQPTTKRRSTNTPINSKQNLTSKTTRKQVGNLDYKTKSRHGHNNIAPNQQYCNKQNSTMKAKRKTSRTLHQQQATQLQQWPLANLAKRTPQPTTTRFSARGKTQQHCTSSTTTSYPHHRRKQARRTGHKPNKQHRRKHKTKTRQGLDQLPILFFCSSLDESFIYL